MTRVTTLAVLFTAAALEVGGDALIRVGLRSTIFWQRVLLFVAAAFILFAYGWTVNRPPWDFGKLLGLYVVFYFVLAQLTSWLAFRQVPSFAILLGGALIIAGGAVIAIGN